MICNNLKFFSNKYVPDTLVYDQMLEQLFIYTSASAVLISNA